MKPQEISSVYFLGIGGIGMSALARYFRHLGAAVSGYDKTPTALTRQLEAEGMKIHFEEDPALIPANTELVIYTPAIPRENKELNFIIKKQILLMKRSEVLGMISSDYFTIAVAGTHGKTTTSTLIAHILKSAGIPHIAFLGGISKNYGTNFLIETSGTKPLVCIVEADEFDRSFLQLTPDIAIVTSADPDHLDIYNTHKEMLASFQEFTGKIRKGGSLIMKAGVGLKPLGQSAYNVFSYSLENKKPSAPTGMKGFKAGGFGIRNGVYHYDFCSANDVWKDLVLGLPGLFNLENALAANAAAFLMGLSQSRVARAMKSFKGVVRRFDFQVKRRGFVYIDDYAHHPEELRACIVAVKEMYPGRSITGVFQPHLYSRTRDLAAEFAESLSLLDEIVLLDIYPAREKPIKGVSSELILEKLKTGNKRLIEKGKLVKYLKKLQPSVLLTLGAGDIDQLVPSVRKAFAK
ncbi:MAG: UDP-N-acetylmuramate--L-alanine ligase [Bacteroidetes bacterium]|nr:UDP-N-acetylmuramate--L-alanine ligase [Bacteroidota bacterium]